MDYYWSRVNPSFALYVHSVVQANDYTLTARTYSMHSSSMHEPKGFRILPGIVVPYISVFVKLGNFFPFYVLFVQKIKLIWLLTPLSGFRLTFDISLLRRSVAGRRMRKLRYTGVQKTREICSWKLLDARVCKGVKLSGVGTCMYSTQLHLFASVNSRVFTSSGVLRNDTFQRQIVIKAIPAQFASLQHATPSCEFFIQGLFQACFLLHAMFVFAMVLSSFSLHISEFLLFSYIVYVVKFPLRSYYLHSSLSAVFLAFALWDLFCCVLFIWLWGFFNIHAIYVVDILQCSVY